MGLKPPWTHMANLIMVKKISDEEEEEEEEEKGVEALNEEPW